MINFKWDKNKAIINIKKHKIFFEEAATVFKDSLSVTFPDPLHSIMENRYLIIGMAENSKILVISHIYDGENIRIISARKATKKEQKFYEN